MLRIFIYIWLLKITVLASDSKGSLEIDTNISPVDKDKVTTTNRVVSQVQKIIEGIRLKTQNTYKQWTKPKKPPKFEVKSTTMRPLVNEIAENVEEGDPNGKTTKKPMTFYFYGALNRKMYEESIEPPEVIEN
uniref:Uncharacterized protein n=1 Tax=Stomoxys calcitrans TaxID=35570 RepID=A0A1I8P8V6_STOCA